jgi:hypothetical protein
LVMIGLRAVRFIPTPRRIWRSTRERIRRPESSAHKTLDTVAAHLRGALRRDGNGDGIFVDVQADIMHDFIRGCLVSLHGYQRSSLVPDLYLCGSVRFGG